MPARYATKLGPLHEESSHMVQHACMITICSVLGCDCKVCKLGPLHGPSFDMVQHACIATICFHVGLPLQGMQPWAPAYLAVSFFCDGMACMHDNCSLLWWAATPVTLWAPWHLYVALPKCNLVRAWVMQDPGSAARGSMG